MSYGWDDPFAVISDHDRELLQPLIDWCREDQQRSLSPERIGALLGIPPATVRDWRAQGALPPGGEPALLWLVSEGDVLAARVRQWQSRKSRSRPVG